MILYFLRHAEAEPGGEGLTEAGVEALRAAAPLWQRLNLRPDVVLTSPLPRAVQTAQLACRALGLSDGPIPDQRLAPGADWGAMARSMAELGDLRSVLFVGHEPDLSRAVQLLTGVSSVRMRKGGLAAVEFYGVPEAGAGELAWLLDPDLYAAVGRMAAEPNGAAPDRSVTRVAAYALCTDAARLLLCRIAPGPWTAVGRWTLPGGGLDFGEPPAQGALRELTEETGLIGEVEGLADVFSWSDRWRHPSDGADEAFHAIQVVFRVRIVGGELRDEPDGSTDRAAWWSLDELRGLPLVQLAWEGVRLAFGVELEAEPIP